MCHNYRTIWLNAPELESMDQILKDLKQHREEVEERFNRLMVAAEQQHRQSNRSMSAAAGKLNQELNELFQLYNDMLQSLIGSVREIHALQNARAAELARQVAVLPAKRIDLMLESIEKRIETLESNVLLRQLEESPDE